MTSKSNTSRGITAKNHIPTRALQRRIGAFRAKDFIGWPLTIRRFVKETKKT